RMSREIPGSVTLGSISPDWKDDGSSFEYVFDRKRYVFDIATEKASVIGDAPEGAGRGGRGGRPTVTAQRGRGRGGDAQPARGRQFDTAESPDHSLRAVYKNRNVWLGKP